MWQVLRVGGEVELDQRLDAWIRTRKPQLAACQRAFERDGQPDREGRAHRCHRLLAADARHVDMAEHDLLHVVELAGAGSCVAQYYLREGGVWVATARLWHQQQPGYRMVGQARADAGKIGHRLDAQAGERGLRADTRAEEDRR